MTMCIYHGNCADGFGAAWAVWKRFPDWEFVPGFYGEAPPDVADRDVVLVDFSYKETVVAQMAEKARSILILDHHKTALDDLGYVRSRMLPPGMDWPDWAAIVRHHEGDGCVVRCLFDLARSGAVIAWEFFHPGEPVPVLLQHIQDRDLWKFDLEGTREIQACVFSYPYDFEVYDDLVARAEQGKWQHLFQEGAAIERKHHKDVAELVETTKRVVTFEGQQIWLANLPYTLASDAGHMLSKMNLVGEVTDHEYPPAGWSMTYFDRGDGIRVFGLRSDGSVDVSEIARKYGGGGHPPAAGFQVPFEQLGPNGVPRAPSS